MNETLQARIDAVTAALRERGWPDDCDDPQAECPLFDAYKPDACPQSDILAAADAAVDYEAAYREMTQRSNDVDLHPVIVSAGRARARRIVDAALGRADDE